MKANRIQPPWTFNDPKTVRRGCPNCGSTRIARVLYGMRGNDEQQEWELSAGRMRLGGCVIAVEQMENGVHPVDPNRYCNDCGTGWSRYVGPQCQLSDAPAPLSS